MTAKIIVGDCRAVLATLPDESVHCVVTSPPYYGLRDYQTATWDGGDPTHEHDRVAARNGRGGSGSPGKQTANAYPSDLPAALCSCGARRIDAQIGLEATPDKYVAEMVAVFRDVRRVLRSDGVCWLVLGDSYAGSGKGGNPEDGKQATNKGSQSIGVLYGTGKTAREAAVTNVTRNVIGVKEKNLLMMPARVALALQADGWILRSQLPWIKRSAMPERTADRPTSAVEYVYLFAKQARYFYDGEAIKRVAASDHPSGNGYKRDARLSYKDDNGARGNDEQWNGVGGSRSFRNSDLFFENLDEPHGAVMDADGEIVALDVNPAGYAEAHFATFPARLIEPLIKAGTSERGVCPTCGAPWVRATERIDQGYDGSRYGERAVEAAGGAKTGGTRQSTLGSSNGKLTGRTATLGWAQSCAHGGDPAPATILDPFCGAATTLLVADRLGRHGIGIELNPAYAAMGERRLRRDGGMFIDVSVSPPSEGVAVPQQAE